MSHKSSRLNPDILTVDQANSAQVIPGRDDVHIVHLDVENLGALQAFMLVDISDIDNWPHAEADHIHVASVHMHFNPGANFSGDIVLGWLSSVTDLGTGVINYIHVWHFALNKATMTDHLLLDWVRPRTVTDNWFGPSEVSGLFQSDVKLFGPDGRQEYVSGDGDVALLCKRTAGNIDIGCTLCYATDAEPEVEDPEPAP